MHKYSFIDAEDSPPTYCNVSYKRDCVAEGCIVSAITNYTTRILNNSLPREDTAQALKFLVHFLGDITQPLHDEAQAFGGNKIPVTWNGVVRNLHGCWDDEMPNRVAAWSPGSGVPAATAIADLARDLTEMTYNGTWSDAERANWTSCVDPTKPESCALEWAQDANRFVCSYVLRSADIAGQELNGTYYDGAKRIIQTQLAKGGLRLGYYLNNLALMGTSRQQNPMRIQEL